MAEALLSTPGPLPVGPTGRNGLGWWGVAMLVASEAALFGYLLFAYYYVGATAGVHWLLERAPDLSITLPNTVLLLLSSVAAWWGESGVEQGKRGRAVAGFALAAIMGSVFAGVQVYEWWEKSYGPATSSYGSLYFVTTGLHLAHVIAGVIILLSLLVWSALDYFSPRRRITVSAGVLYWHFVDAIWICVFVTYFVTPYLGFGR